MDPRYEGTYRVIRIKGNQVELTCNGTVTPTKWAHISPLKPLLQADEITEHLPKESAFARKTKLALNPDKIPDLDWKRATDQLLNMQFHTRPFKLHQTFLKKGREVV